jgi:hypothetical protein
MEPTRYDILRRENDRVAIWLETSADLNTAKSRIKRIVSFWPGRYEVVEHHSQQIVAAVGGPTRLRVSLRRMRERARGSFWASYEWLLAPAPRVADLAAYKGMQKYARDCYRTSCEWLCASMALVQAYRSR